MDNLDQRTSNAGVFLMNDIAGPAQKLEKESTQNDNIEAHSVLQLFDRQFVY